MERVYYEQETGHILASDYFTKSKDIQLFHEEQRGEEKPKHKWTEIREQVL